MLTYLANDFRYEIGRFHHIQHSESRPFPRQGPLARTQYHHQPTPRFGQKVVQFIAHSTDAEHPFHGIVSSHSTAS